MEHRQDKRTLHALRKHIDKLLAAGAVITSREPVTIQSAGETLKVRHGMLIGYSGFADMVEPVTDHEWPDALRQMAIDLCTKQLDEAIRALETDHPFAEWDLAANDGSIPS